MRTYNDFELVDYPNFTFRGFTLEIGRSENKPTVQERVDKELKSDSHISEWSFDESSTNLVKVTPQRSSQRILSVVQAWNLTERLCKLPGVLYAEPLFVLPIAPVICRRGPSCPSGIDQVNHLSETENPDWSLEQIQVFKAWEKFLEKHHNKLPGHSIVIGHPDTGYLLHPEIEANLDLKKGRDFVDGDCKPIDEVENGGFLPVPGHGTSTASALISSRGAQKKYPNDPSGKAVTGVVPNATLIPLRIHSTISDFDIFDPALARAIEYASEQGAHVISISMGGPPSCRLRRAISYALERGVIVVAAAGNILPFVVWPAAYDDVIAVASSNAKGEISQYSSWGGKVDVAAPGESVWCATVRKNNGELEYLVERESGTSLAVAFVAGVAALWLSYHGRDELIEKYGVEKIPVVFNKILRQSCHQPKEWDTNKYGAGIVDAYKVLEAKLPDKDDPDLRVTPAFDSQSCDPFKHLIETARSNAELVEAVRSGVLQSKFAELVGTSGEELPDKEKELLDKLRNALLSDEDVSAKVS